MNIQDSLTDIQNNTARVQAETVKTRGGSQDMNQDMFLQLLMTQLKNQDPLNPMDTNQFMAQQAQFTQISELQKLNSSNQMVQASNLIGQQVTLTDPTTGNIIAGAVSGAEISPSGTNVIVNGQSYPVRAISGINNGTAPQDSTIQLSDLVGRQVTLKDPADETKTITGTVDETSLDANGTNIIVNGKTYPVSSLKSVTKFITNPSQLGQVNGLVGKEVTLTDANEENIRGAVTGVRVGANGTSVIVGGKSYTLDTITSIEEPLSI